MPQTSETQTICKATKNDISAIMHIAEECKLSFWSERDYLSELENTNSLIKVTRENDIIVGFILARFNFINFKEKTVAETFSEADLLNIGVLDSFREQGIGSRLLEALILECKNSKTQKIWLEVRESNSNARKFYKQNGFIETQIRRGFYSNPTENAVLMFLDITK